MIYSLITVGGVLFWALLAIAAIFMVSLVHREQTGKSAVLLLISVAILVAFSNITGLIGDITLEQILYGVLGYLAIASVWAIIKWRLFYLPALFERYDAIRADWLHGKNLKEMPADPTIRDEFKNHYPIKSLDIGYRRMVRNNKARIISWMMFWPWSLVGTFLGDFLVRVTTTMFNGISSMLQTMSDRMASKYSELN